MERIQRYMNMIADMLQTKHKRQIAGGILLSASLFFGGLAITAMSIKTEEQNE